MGHGARFEGEFNLRAAFACKRGLYNPSILPALKTLAQEVSIFAMFLRRSPLLIPNSCLMATVNLDHAQFWDFISSTLPHYTA
jgi:hypothetical protein